MKRRTSSILTPIMTLLLVGPCLIIIAALLGLYIAPRLALEDFGPPAPGLDRFQQGLYAFQLLLKKDSLTLSVDPKGAQKTIQIQAGESVNEIALDFEIKGIIRDASAFRLYLIYSGLDKGIQAGTHQLSAAQNAMEIAAAIQDATPKTLSIKILPGWRLEEIAAALPANGFSITAIDFLATTNLLNGSTVLPGYPSISGVEGYLLPGTYTFGRDATSADILAAMLQNFDKQVTQDIRDGFKSQGLTLSQAVVLASIVQKEAVVIDEMPTIASVFYNRLQDGMRLESDPTAQYALGYIPSQNTWWKNPLNQSDLKVNSPYNTYIVTGLPPGPICVPSLAALKAVAFPAQTPYYYFRARCDGSGRHNFSATYDEQIQNACP